MVENSYNMYELSFVIKTTIGVIGLSTLNTLLIESPVFRPFRLVFAFKEVPRINSTLMGFFISPSPRRPLGFSPLIPIQYFRCFLISVISLFSQVGSGVFMCINTILEGFPRFFYRIQIAERVVCFTGVHRSIKGSSICATSRFVLSFKKASRIHISLFGFSVSSTPFGALGFSSLSHGFISGFGLCSLSSTSLGISHVFGFGWWSAPPPPI